MEDHFPVLRVFLLGPFRVELVQPDGETRVLEDFEALLGRDLSAILFKLILIHPERRVKRDVLVRTLWPGQSLTSIRHSLEVTKSKLGRTLEELCRRSLLPRAIGNPPVYAIASQTEIWTDLEACSQVQSLALSTTDPPSSLGYWEEVYTFMQRGELLASDTTAYWYQSSLIQDRRKKLIQVRRQCVLRIADLSLECGDISRAFAVLTQECAAHPADEDLSLHLMNVLARLGRYPEALARYTQLEASLLERGAEPADVTKHLALWLRGAGVTNSSSSWSSADF
jgi:DNA-binding SARP family transcriptional activator